jgi:hypothetical protein
MLSMSRKLLSELMHLGMSYAAQFGHGHSPNGQRLRFDFPAIGYWPSAEGLLRSDTPDHPAGITCRR